MTNAMSTGSTNGPESTKFNNPPLNQLLYQITNTKLEQGNYLLWKTFALPILQSYKLEGHLSDKNPCPPMFLPILGDSSTLVATNAEGASSSQMISKVVVSTSIEISLNPHLRHGFLKISFS